MSSDPGLTFFNYCKRQENAQMSKRQEEAGTLHLAEKEMHEQEARCGGHGFIPEQIKVNRLAQI